MKSLTTVLESTLSEIYKEKHSLEKKYNSLGETAPELIEKGEIKSKLFWLCKMSEKVKDDMDEYRVLTEHINLIKIS